MQCFTIDDKAIFDKPMTLSTADFKPAGTITGTGSTIVIDHTTDNALATFRFANAAVKMAAAEQPFEMAGHKFAAGAFIIANANRAALEPQIKELGLLAWATDAAPNVPTHDLDVPRIGYVHSWSSTQDEGWVRMALDKLKIPYTYFGDNLLRKGNLRAKYDVIIYPNGPITVDGGEIPATGAPQPYKKTDLTPNIGSAPDQTDDRRGSLGRDGLNALEAFVSDGGVLIAEGAPASTLVDYKMAPGVSVEQPSGLFAPGSVLKAVFGDKTSPILYGYDQNAIGVMYKNGPVLSVGGGAGRGGGGGRGGDLPPGVGGGNLQPMAAPPRLATLDGPAPRTCGGGRWPRGRRASAAAGAAAQARAVTDGRAARRAVVPDRSERPAAVRCAGRRRGHRGQAGRRRRAARQGARRAVRRPALLALPDPGELLPRVQRDAELERSRRRAQVGGQDRAGAGAGRPPLVSSEDSCRSICEATPSRSPRPPCARR